MNKHTPGPWRFGKNGDDVVADTSGGHNEDPASLRYYGGHLIAESICARNRTLIAAAPKLLEALRETTDALECLRRGHGVEVSSMCYPALNNARKVLELFGDEE